MSDTQPTYPVVVDAALAADDLDVTWHGLGQGGIDDAALTAPVIEKVAALGPRTFRFFVQEYFRMMEAPGQYHWTTIDAMLRSVVATGAQPILSLCMKPPCLYPRIDHAVTEPSSWRHWEEFISAMAGHFSGELNLPGLWYEVGNEPNLGETGGCPYLFSPEGYAEYYARTVRAVLRGDPTAKVGGPALAGSPAAAPEIPQALLHRVQRDNLPVDFFSWHAYTADGEDLAGQIVAAKRLLRDWGPPFSDAPTVLDEWNMSFVCVLEFGEFLQAAYVVDTLARLLDAGLDVSNYYHTMDMRLDLSKWATWYSDERREWMRSFWYSAFHGLHLLEADGEAAAAYVAFRMLYQVQGRRIPLDRPAPNVGTLACRTERGCRILAWNYHPRSVCPVELDLRAVNLPAGPLTERHFVLGGSLTDFDCVLAMRKGEMKLQSQADHPAGKEFRRKLSLAPYSVHLITLEPTG